MKLGFFVKIKSCHKKIKKDYLVKTLKNYFLKKIECLTSTYKNGHLRDKLPNKTMYR